MFWLKAYNRRESLSDAQLERLLSELKDQVERYRIAIRNYPPDRMEQYGRPFLDDLEGRVTKVAQIINERAASRN
ncbi:hypothetical protein A6F68_01819 [Tsuneonella dongtanensis]|uniref:Uncharacterized protein n=1 Tax=Tsuneonella dongtanensis TaxID=692370 RepID=A0A1B2ADU9_9SPHN|nr:hypothetical protein A6F68_01819 [Tsuneonella dongtanensis]